MPAPIVKSFADKTGKSVAEVEKLWDKAKSLAKEEYPDVAEDSDRFYQIVTGILKKMLKINESETLSVVKRVLREQIEKQPETSIEEAAKKGDKEAYQKFFRKALEKFGVTEPDQLEGEKRKEFYDYIDANWEADKEED